MKNITEELKEMITSTIISMMDQINISKSSSDQKDWQKAQDPSTVVPANRRASTLDSGNSTKQCGMWNLKHKINAPELHKILIKIELKSDTAIYLMNLYNHTNIGLN